jgi:hypothetical protein
MNGFLRYAGMLSTFVGVDMAAAPFACILDATPRAMELIHSHYT